MVDSAGAQSPPEIVSDLHAAADRVQAAEAAIDEHGEASVEAAADAYRQATRLLDSYEDSATGTGDFTAYLQFQNEILALVGSLPEDTFAANAFERVSDRIDKRRLNEADFEFAREQVEIAGEAVELLEEREDAIAAYREARNAAKQALDDRREEADRLRDLQRLADVDLDADIGPLRERVDRRMTPARWKHDYVRQRVEENVPLAEAIWGMQNAYISQQEETLLSGTFLDWLDR